MNTFNILAQQSLKWSRVKRIEIGNKVKNIETAVGKSETLLKRSTNTELAQIDKTPSIIIPKEVDDEREEADWVRQSFRGKWILKDKNKRWRNRLYSYVSQQDQSGSIDCWRKRTHWSYCWNSSELCFNNEKCWRTTMLQKAWPSNSGNRKSLFHLVE